MEKPDTGHPRRAFDWIVTIETVHYETVRGATREQAEKTALRLAGGAGSVGRSVKAVGAERI
jgi:hypothetical protein